MKDYYLILGIDRGSNQEQIKEAYRRQVKDTHPDHNRMLDGSRFREVQEAYEVLSNPTSRRDYNVEIDRQERRSRIGRTTRVPAGAPHVWPTGSERPRSWQDPDDRRMRGDFDDGWVEPDFGGADLAEQIRALRRRIYQSLYEDWTERFF